MGTVVDENYRVDIQGRWVNFYTRQTQPFLSQWEFKFSMPTDTVSRLFGMIAKQIAKQHAAAKHRAAFVDPGVA